LKDYIKIGFIIFVLALSCSPERDNPYDPKSPHQNYSQIIGRIITKHNQPIMDVQITLNFNNNSKLISTNSDTNGNYNIEYFYSLDLGDSAVICTNKDKYAESQKSISLGLKKSDTVNFILDAVPQLTAESVISIHEQRYYPADIYSAYFSVRINDPDGIDDIDSTSLVIPSESTSFILEHTNGDVYQDTVFAESLPDRTLEELVGNDCYFEVVSDSHLRTQSNPVRLSRIIYEVPQPVTPFEDTVSHNFYCTWNSVQLNFPYTYGVEVYYTTPYERIIAYSTDTIPSNDTIIQIPVTLPSNPNNNYYWRVLVKDNFGNTAKSVSARFYLHP
jgi:hypothetical protein